MIHPSRCVLPLVILLLGAAPPQNPYLVAAIRLYQNLQFEAALEQLKKAESQSSGIADDVAIHTYRGLLQLELNHPEQAETEFNVALSLDIDAPLPSDVSPKVKQKWAAVRAAVLRTRVSLPALDAGAPTPLDAGSIAVEPMDAGAPDLRPVPREPAGGISEPPRASSAAPTFVGATGAAGVLLGGGLLAYGEAQGNAATSQHYNLDGANQLHHARVEAGVGAALLGAGVLTVAVAVVLALSH